MLHNGAALRDRGDDNAGSAAFSSPKGVPMLHDDDSVRSAYDAHGPELYRFCRAMLGDGSLAEDAVQESFVRAWRSHERFDPATASLRTWLFAIARNVVIDMHRRSAARPVVGGQLHDGMAAVGDHADQVVLGLQLRQGLAGLTDDQRHAVTEIALRGRTSADVAQELGASDSTVRSRLYYGLKAMRGAIQRKEWSDA